MYAWRQMSEGMRDDVLEQRKLRQRPWHSPPHWASDRANRYMVTAACYEHRPIISSSMERLAEFEDALLSAIEFVSERLHAWVVLPNHYHILVTTDDPLGLLKEMGKLHGRTSFQWNGEDRMRGRKVWYGAAETLMKSERHFWATLNYIHHNPVKHGLVKAWQEWPFSSAGQFIDTCGRSEAERLWREFPISEFGKGWDD
jgi:putative transposase